MKKSICFSAVSLVVLGVVSLSSCSSNGNCKKTESQTLAVVETPDKAIAVLKAGNHRFMVDSLMFPNSNHKRVEETAPEQKPFVAIVGCSDSRVPVELIFDQGIGDMFVVRTAGNSVGDDITMGSVDYAVCHLGVKLVVVLGHTACGGVTGAITHGDDKDGHSSDDGKVGDLLEILQNDVKQFVGNPDKITEAVFVNARSQVAKLTSNPVVAQRIANEQIKVVPAVYDVQTGEVKFF